MAKRKKKLVPQPSHRPLIAAQRPRFTWHELAGFIVLALATMWVYWPAIHGEPLWDDPSHITRPDLRSSEGLYRIWFDLGTTQQYYPLLHSAFWLEHKLWGDHTFGYHLINVVLHFAAALLVYFIVRRLSIPGAWLAAAIFALHPVHVESVAWISEQKNTLSAVFYLAAMLVYLHFDTNRRGVYYTAAFVLFVLGLLCKTVTATLPAALLVIFWWQRGTISWRRDVLPLTPFFVLATIAGLFTAWVERKLIGAEGADFELSLLERGLLAGRVVSFYLGKLVWPSDLTFIYPRWEVDASSWWQWLFPIAALAVLATLFGVRGRWRGPLAGVLLFVGTLVPVLGFLNVYPFIYSFVADHFQYLASLGIIVLVAAMAATAISRLSERERFNACCACVLILGVLAVVSRKQSRLYRDNVTLYEATVADNPECWLAHNNLGLVYAGQGDSDRAIAHFEEALRREQDRAEIYNNLALELAKTGRRDEAIRRFEETIRLRPEFAEPHHNLAIIYAARGETEQAIAHFERALKVNADYPDAHVHLASVLWQTGRVDEATAHFEEALRLDPADAAAHNNYAMLLYESGKTNEALAHLRLAVKLKSRYTDARWNLANVLNRLGRHSEAVPHLEQMVRLRPKDVQVRLDLAAAYAMDGQLPEARKHASTALSLARAAGDAAAVAKIEAWMAGLPAGERNTRAVPQP